MSTDERKKLEAARDAAERRYKRAQFIAAESVTARREACASYNNACMVCDECARANVPKHCLLATMHANGGSFVSQLALAAGKADPTNYGKLQVAFPEIWNRYAQMFVDAQPNEEAV